MDEEGARTSKSEKGKHFQRVLEFEWKSSLFKICSYKKATCSLLSTDNIVRTRN